VEELTPKVFSLLDLARSSMSLVTQICQGYLGNSSYSISHTISDVPSKRSKLSACTAAVKRSLFETNIAKQTIVCDVGFGKGNDLGRYDSVSPSVVRAFDIDEVAIKTAMARYASTDYDFGLSLEVAKFPSGRADVLVMMNSAQHYTQSELNSILDTLTPGVALFLYPTEQDSFVAPDFAYQDDRGNVELTRAPIFRSFLRDYEQIVNQDMWSYMEDMCWGRNAEYSVPLEVASYMKTFQVIVVRRIFRSITVLPYCDFTLKLFPDEVSAIEFVEDKLARCKSFPPPVKNLTSVPSEALMYASKIDGVRCKGVYLHDCQCLLFLFDHELWVYASHYMAFSDKFRLSDSCEPVVCDLEVFPSSTYFLPMSEFPVGYVPSAKSPIHRYSSVDVHGICVLDVFIEAPFYRRNAFMNGMFCATQCYTTLTSIRSMSGKSSCLAFPSQMITESTPLAMREGLIMVPRDNYLNCSKIWKYKYQNAQTIDFETIQKPCEDGQVVYSLGLRDSGRLVPISQKDPLSVLPPWHFSYPSLVVPVIADRGVASYFYHVRSDSNKLVLGLAKTRQDKKIANDVVTVRDLMFSARAFPTLHYLYGLLSAYHLIHFGRDAIAY
jgi:hypothetical protein